MLTKVEVVYKSHSAWSSNPRLLLDITDPKDYVVRNIEGVTPPKITVNSHTRGGGYQGAVYSGSRTEPRELTFTIGFNEDHSRTTITHLRTQLYDYFKPLEPVVMYFTDSDIGTVMIEGFVETHESNVFSDEPLSQITVICHQPYFYNNTTRTINYDVPPNSVFRTPIEYLGTADTGLSIQVHVPDENTFRDIYRVELYSNTILTRGPHFVLSGYYESDIYRWRNNLKISIGTGIADNDLRYAILTTNTTITEDTLSSSSTQSVIQNMTRTSSWLKFNKYSFDDLRIRIGFRDNSTYAKPLNVTYRYKDMHLGL